MSNRAEGSAAIPNWMIRDKSVPRNAILVYASLSSRGGLGAIYPSQATIAEESGVSERTVRTMIQHLETLGVVHRQRRKVPGARRVTDAYTLHPNGRADLPAEVAASSDLPANQPARGASSTGSQEQIVPLIDVNTQEVAREEGHAFDEFWSVWPKKNAKRDAERAWDRAIKKADPALIVAAARAFAESPYRPDKQFVPYGATWLNGERWTDPAPEPQRAVAGAGRSTPDDRFRDGLDRGQRLAALVDSEQRGLTA